jgi:hypothetical protein
MILTVSFQHENMAFSNSYILVTSYKHASGQAYLPAGQRWFNEKINSPHSSVENAVGIWKGLFHGFITFICISEINNEW